MGEVKAGVSLRFRDGDVDGYAEPRQNVDERLTIELIDIAVDQRAGART